MKRQSQIVVIGHSHVKALIGAYSKRENKGRFSFIDLNEPRFKNAATEVNGKIALKAEPQAEIDRLRSEHPTAQFAPCIGGAMHNGLGLTVHPEPFTFRNPWKEVSLAPGVRVIPFAAAKAMMRETLTYQLRVLRGLARALGSPPQIQSPPPVPSEEAIRCTLGVYGEAIAEYGVAEPAFRYAMWRLQSDIFEEVAKEEGWPFVPAPAEAIDADGFLLKAAWKDPTHGNSWYGECVLKMIENFIARPAHPVHPYKRLPDHAFWRRSVMETKELDPVVKGLFTISPADKVATAGSCSAQHIARHLKKRGFNYFVAEPAHELMPEKLASDFNYGTFSARFGNVYTARQLRQLMLRAFGEFSPEEEDWAEPDGRFIDPFRPQIQPGGFSSLEELRADRRAHLEAVKKLFLELDVFVFTLGLTECWVSNADGAVFPVCPGVPGGSFDADLYSFRRWNVQETTEDMLWVIDRLRTVNPKSKVVLTVSPVPLMATAVPGQHVLVLTTHSMAVLRVAAEEISAQREAIAYFPSYEIITGAFNRGADLAKDLRAVTEEGVDHVMRTFIKHYTTQEQESPPVQTPSVVQAAPAEQSYQERMAHVVEVNCDEQALDSY